jgi:hypothetical protein
VLNVAAATVAARGIGGWSFDDVVPREPQLAPDGLRLTRCVQCLAIVLRAEQAENLLRKRLAVGFALLFFASLPGGFALPVAILALDLFLSASGCLLSSVLACWRSCYVLRYLG